MWRPSGTFSYKGVETLLKGGKLYVHVHVYEFQKEQH